MATIRGAEEMFRRFSEGYPPMVEKVITANRDVLEADIREQLESGLDGNEKELRPNYLNDPYFKTREEAEKYMRWKERITPPMQSTLGLRPRAVKTPNLRINGFYHHSIQAVPVAGGVRIGSQGVGFSGEIEGKYGGALYKVGRTARRKFYREHLRTALKEYYRRFGL